MRALLRNIVPGIAALAIAGCDNTVPVTVKGLAIDVDTFAAQRFQGKTGADSIAAAVRKQAVVYPDTDKKSKSAPTGADGAFTLNFRAVPGTEFRLMTEGGSHPPVLWPVSFKVGELPAGKEAVEISAGGTFACRDDAVQLAVAKKAGFATVADMLQNAGTCMFINLGNGPSPDITLTTDATITLNPSAGFEVFPVNMTADMQSSVVTGASPLGLYIIMKRFKAGEPEEASVELQTTDPVQTAPRPFKFAPVKCPIRKGYVTDLINAPTAN